MINAVKAIQKYITKNFTEQEIDDMGFFPDTVNSTGYTYHIELYKKRIDLTYNYKSKVVTVINH